MDRTEMLHEMCHDVLSQADVKAICKFRGLPARCASSRSLLESLLVSDTGVAAALETLDRREIALLHLLKAIDKPVDVAFFSRVYPAKNEESYYATFTQRYQGVFSKVKDRLVRRGILILALAPEGWSKKTKMERWQFALPRQFVPRLPPTVESPKRLDGEGEWRSDVAREKLKTTVSKSSGETNSGKLEIVDGELRLDGQSFRAARLLEWQKKRWQEETTQKKRRKSDDPYAFLPTEAVIQILAGLDAGFWVDTDGLTGPLAIFCGSKVDSRALCESGWRWGCMARQKADGKTWYRIAPQLSAADVSPDFYLDVTADDNVTVDLDTVPFESLERLVVISDQRPAPGRRPVLLLAPNVVKLGRAADAVLALPLVDWLRRNSSAFRQATETLRRLRGKTIVHENLSVARVGDLTLKVAIEKALGQRIVSLGEDYIAFPTKMVGDVKRIVTKSGHVVKEASRREH